LEVLDELNWEGFEDDFNRLTRRIEADDRARAEWIRDSGEIDEQLAGKDKRRNKPWPHAAELSIPLTKKLLRRWTPVLYNLIALADPISYFKSSNAKAALQAPTVEQFFSWLIKDHMEGSLAEIRYLIHNIGSKGIGYLGVSWDYRSESETRVVVADNVWPQGVPRDIRQVVRDLHDQYEIRDLKGPLRRQLLVAAAALSQGRKFVKISFERVISDKPKITSHHPFDVIVPPNSGAAEDAEYVCLIHDLTASQLRQMARDGTLNALAVEELIKRAGEDHRGDEKGADGKGRRYDSSAAETILRDQQQDAGVTTHESDKFIRVYQVYCMLDHNGDGIAERCVLWYSPIGGDLRLALHEFPFSFRYWPIVRFDYENVDRRPYLAGGMGRHLKDIQDQYNKQYRATSDAIDIQLAPTFQKRAMSKWEPRTFKWGPGRVVEVQQIGDIAPIEKSPFNLHQYLQDRGELKLFAEEMVGTVDSALAATGKNLERRTAFEVQQVAGQIEAVQGMDSAIFQSSMAKVFQGVWDMWLDLGSEAVFFNVTGEQEPQPFRKADYSYKYQLTPAGTPGNTNRNAELNKVLQFIQIVAQTAPQMANWPFLMTYVARLIDPRISQLVLLPEAQQQVNQLLNSVAQQVAAGNLPEAAQALLTSSAEGAGGGATP
jgi:hypothetical protein